MKQFKKNKVLAALPHEQQGSMVVQGIITVGVLGAVAAGGNFLYTDYRMNQEAKSAAQTFDQATQAVIAYTQNNQTALLGNQSPHLA
jgi:uncharacterized membrane protein YebE (DUF533 family)